MMLAVALAALLASALGASWSDGEDASTGVEQITLPAVPIALAPGWNLISLPFQPYAPAIDVIAPLGHPADVVMTFDSAQKVWAVSQRDPETGLFSGDIQGDERRQGLFCPHGQLSPIAGG